MFLHINVAPRQRSSLISTPRRDSDEANNIPSKLHSLKVVKPLQFYEGAPLQGCLYMKEKLIYRVVLRNMRGHLLYKLSQLAFNIHQGFIKKSQLNLLLIFQSSPFNTSSVN